MPKIESHRNPELTDREKEVYGLARRGLNQIRIATDLKISPKTVYSHIDSIERKTGKNLTQIAAEGSQANDELKDIALSPRQTEIVALISQGLSRQEIEQRLSISPKTFNEHVSRVDKKITLPKEDKRRGPVFIAQALGFLFKKEPVPAPNQGTASLPSLEPSPSHGLSLKEQTVYVYIQQGLSNKQICQKMGLGPSSVSFHITNIEAKTGLNRNMIASTAEGTIDPSVKLTDKQEQVAELMIQGFNDKEIGDKLGVSMKDIRGISSRIKDQILPKQTGLRSKSEMLVVLGAYFRNKNTKPDSTS